MNEIKYVGLDVHSATTVAAVVDSRGKLVMHSILETKSETIRDFFRGLADPCTRPSRRGRKRRGSMI
jgi:ribosomal protein L13E